MWALPCFQSCHTEVRHRLKGSHQPRVSCRVPVAAMQCPSLLTETPHVKAEKARPCVLQKAGPLCEVSRAEVTSEDTLTTTRSHTIASVQSQSQHGEIRWAGAEVWAYIHHRIHLVSSQRLRERKSRGLNQAILDWLISYFPALWQIWLRKGKNKKAERGQAQKPLTGL